MQTWFCFFGDKDHWVNILNLCPWGDCDCQKGFCSSIIRIKIQPCQLNFRIFYNISLLFLNLTNHINLTSHIIKIVTQIPQISRLLMKLLKQLTIMMQSTTELSVWSMASKMLMLQTICFNFAASSKGSYWSSIWCHQSWCKYWK